jgi:hypothetical protein
MKKHIAYRELVISTLTIAIVTFSLNWVQAAVPTLQIEPIPEGLKISWPASDGADYMLEESADLAAWTNSNQIIVKEDDLHRAFVPNAEAAAFYRLVNDGINVEAAYVGSAACSTCHSSTYGDFIQSGHPYKLNKVDGASPTYPHGNDLTPPAGYSWDDISWVIGGANWKARFIDQEGYIITGTNVQYNLVDGSWTAYHSSEAVGTKPYNCGSCHTTGWRDVGDGGVNQNGQPGMHGSFSEAGVHCEACHGPASRHTQSMSADDITIDTTSSLCGSCHVRGDINTIPASGGYIKHHEQYNEMLSAGHSGRKCVTCHDPHVAVGQPGGIISSCTDCHGTYDTGFHGGDATCVDCHMPKVSKNAVAESQYVGDLRTHIFKVNTSATDEMFTPDGSFVSSTGVTLSFVCYQCHEDSVGGGGSEPMMSLEDLSAEAQGYHQQ